MSEEIEVYEDVTIYRPSRFTRRQLAGRLCGYCGNRLHCKDILAVVSQLSTEYWHPRCVELAVKPTQPSAEREESTPAANLEEIVTDGNED